FYLVQHFEANHAGRAIDAVEYIGFDEDTRTLRSHMMDNAGSNFTYTWQLDGDVLAIWFGEKGSDNFFTGTFDPDGDKVKAEYEWYLLGGAKVGGVKSTLQPTGTAFAQRIPSGAFKDGQTIHWRVRGIDTSDLAGPWSGWCDLTVDTTRPDKAPTVLSYDYPERELNGSIGKTGWFHLDANGVTDVDGFYFDLQDGASRFAKANKAGGWVDVPVTPPDFGPFTLWVYSADKAGNRSVEPKKYEFLVGRGWQPVGQCVSVHTTTLCAVHERVPPEQPTPDHRTGQFPFGRGRDLSQGLPRLRDRR
ncbi:hypothetical protein ACFQ1S_31430, partial [Kibdelosporangium lantanae]